MGLIQSKKKHLNCLRPFVYLVTGNSTKIYFASWSSRIKECMEKNHWSPTQILKMFKRLDNELVIEHLKWHFKPTRPLSFDHLFSINDDMTVHCTKNHPIQLNVAKLMICSLSTINRVKAGPIFASINISNKRKQIMPVEVYNK
jgi:hypothetical protein